MPSAWNEETKLNEGSHDADETSPESIPEVVGDWDGQEELEAEEDRRPNLEILDHGQHRGEVSCKKEINTNTT